ncbi:MAG: hypothetical protein A2Y75_08185 [Candidatus Solincola sediminis]|uniref:Uncharacterized protein n=1 Tax=Candidatus Solincola sediminis TaxID=1797199 RepID=A0A1F2WLA0_9ACTN|nr:MAG: hypothetical protein A2Y75_08185 [Candidatus Solincola sediminis]
MNENINPGQVDEIQELIRREKEEAERSFEGHGFDAQLSERIGKAREGRSAAWHVFLKKPGPIVAFSVLVLALVGLLLFRTFSPPPFQQTVRAMSAVLAGAGDGQETSGQNRTAQRIARAEYTEFGWAVKRVLYACERQPLGDVSLMDALSPIFLEKASLAAPSQEGENASSPRVESPKLRTGEDFQMFFAGFLKKFEEV